MNKKGQFFPYKDDNPRTITPYVNWILIGVNIVAFIVSLSSFEYYISEQGFTPENFEITDLFTSMFLHGSIAHIFGNLWFLLIFGDNVEDVFGHVKYVLFYLISGIVASLTHFALNIGSLIPSVGASGAISGVLGAYLVLFPKAGVYVPGSFGHMGKISAKLMLGLWFGFQLISGSVSLLGVNSGIAFFAHIGGFIFGALVALIYRKSNKNYGHINA